MVSLIESDIEQARVFCATDNWSRHCQITTLRSSFLMTAVKNMNGIHPRVNREEERIRNLRIVDKNDLINKQLYLQFTSPGLFFGRRLCPHSLRRQSAGRERRRTAVFAGYCPHYTGEIWKFIKCFSSTLRRRNLKTSWCHHFRKALFLKCCPSSRCFQIPPVEGRFS